MKSAMLEGATLVVTLATPMMISPLLSALPAPLDIRRTDDRPPSTVTGNTDGRIFDRHVIPQECGRSACIRVVDRNLLIYKGPLSFRSASPPSGRRRHLS